MIPAPSKARQATALKLERLAKEMERSPVEVYPEAMEVLMSYRWPGNVRQGEIHYNGTTYTGNHDE